MANVEVSASLKYGFKLFAYLLCVVVLGGGGMALGAALAGPVLLDGTVTDELDSPELLGGLVLGALGLAIWVTGLFGLSYKLLADAVQWGVSTGTGPLPTEQRASDKPAEPPIRESIEGVGPSPGEQTAREFGPESTVPSAAGVPDRPTNGATAGTGPQPDDDERPDRAGGTETAPPAEDTATEGPTATEPTRAGDGTPADEQRGQNGTSPDAEGTPTDSDAGSTESQERTAEQIAFGTDEEGQPAQRLGTAGDEHDSEREGTGASPMADEPDEGSIPPYEAMDESGPQGEESADGSDAVPGETEPTDTDTDAGDDVSDSPDDDNTLAGNDEPVGDASETAANERGTDDRNADGVDTDDVDTDDRDTGGVDTDDVDTDDADTDDLFSSAPSSGTEPPMEPRSGDESPERVEGPETEMGAEDGDGADAHEDGRSEEDDTSRTDPLSDPLDDDS